MNQNQIPIKTDNLVLLEKVIEEVDYSIIPTVKESEDEKKLALNIADKIQISLAQYPVKVFLVGSTARDTGLRGDRDIDLFVSFPQSFSKDEIVNLTFKATKMSVAADWQTRYAQHPYLQTIIDGYAVEVIPCFSVDPNTPIKSAVDRSPLHMDYLQKRLSSSQKRDVRVLKKLLKNIGIYGAESRVEGFSGLLCEYLILNYRSLSNFLVSASNWIPPIVVDIEGTRSQTEQDVINLTSQFSTQLILIDAIDSNRNVAASVSSTAFSSLVSIANAILQNPSTDFFFNNSAKKSPMDSFEIEKQIKKRGTSFAAISFPVPSSLVQDIVCPQIRKTTQSISQKLTLEGFSVMDSHWYLEGTNVLIFFELENLNRPKVKKLYGPPAWLHLQSTDFISNHLQESILRGPYISEEKVVLEVQRQITESNKFLVELIKTDNSISIGPDIKEGFNRAKVFSHQELIETLSNPEFSYFNLAFEEYLFRHCSWF